MTSDEPSFDAERALHDIRTHVRVIQDELTTSSTRATHGEWLAERVEELDTWLTQRVHDVALPRDWAHDASWTARRPTRRDDATHPRELPEPDPVDEVVAELNAFTTWTEPDEHATVATLESAITAGELLRRKLNGGL